MPTDAELLKKFNIVAQYREHAPQDVKKPWIGALVDAELQKNDHLFFGEPHVNGVMLKAYEMLAQNADIFAAAAKNGVKHVVLEFPEPLQRHLDDYAAHAKSRDDLQYYLFENPFRRFASPWMAGDAEKQFQQNFIKVVDNAQAAGLSVHFADLSCNKFFAALPQEFIDLQKTLIARHEEEKSPLSILEYIAEYERNLAPEEAQRLLKILSDFQQENRARRMDDTDQYNYLRSRIPAGEGMIGVVGLSHLDDCVGRDAGINIWLKREGASVATIEIYDRPNTSDYVAESYAATGQVKRIEPDYTIFLEEDALLAKGESAVSYPSASPRVPSTAAAGVLKQG
jgi:hypothetical protein